MALQLKKRLITVGEYHKMAEAGILQESGIELINGEIVEKDQITSQHAAMSSKLNQILHQQLHDKAIMRIQDPIIANDFSEPEPDVAILKYRADFYEHEHPYGRDVLLVIEIGDTSVAYDRKFKLPLYAESGVAECWLINLAKQEIYTYWQPTGNAYKFSEFVQKGEVVKAQYFELALDTNQLF
jgi:Uma2 family endonuclease